MNVFTAPFYARSLRKEIENEKKALVKQREFLGENKKEFIEQALPPVAFGLITAMVLKKIAGTNESEAKLDKQESNDSSDSVIALLLGWGLKNIIGELVKKQVTEHVSRSSKSELQSESNS